MATAISYFNLDKELLHISEMVHGAPISSTRAELMGCLISIEVLLLLEDEIGRALDLDLYCDNQHSVNVVNLITPPGKKNNDI